MLTIGNSRLLASVAVMLAASLLSTYAIAQPRSSGGFGDGSGVRGTGAGIRGRGAGAPSRGRSNSGIESRHYLFEETGEELEYFVYVSNRVDEDEPSPLVIALHGMGVPPEVMLSQIRDEARRHAYIVAAPLGYNVRGGYGAYPDGLGRGSDSTVNRWSEQDVMNVLDRMRDEFNVDERRIYLVGQSMGGAGALHLGTKYPEIWAAVGATAPAVSDGEPTGLENARTMPFILVHGQDDRGIPIERSRRWAARMDELGIEFEFYEIRNGGHSDALISGVPYVFNFFDEHIKPTVR